MPTHHRKATLFRAKGPEQSGFMMDAVTKNGVAAGNIAVRPVVHARKRPYRPLTRSYAPAAATALP